MMVAEEKTLLEKLFGSPDKLLEWGVNAVIVFDMGYLSKVLIDKLAGVTPRHGHGAHVKVIQESGRGGVQESD